MSTLLGLSHDLLLQVLEYLDPVSLACVCCSCRALRVSAEDTQLWHSLCMSRWNHLNQHVCPDSSAGCDWKGLYGLQNGWKLPESDFCQARIECKDRQQIQCFEICNASDIGTSSVDAGELLLLTYCAGSDLPGVDGLKVHTLPSSKCPRGAYLGDGNAVESLFVLRTLPSGIVAAGSVDATLLLSFEDVQKGRIRCVQPVVEFSLPDRCARPPQVVSVVMLLEGWTVPALAQCC